MINYCIQLSWTFEIIYLEHKIYNKYFIKYIKILLFKV